MARFLRSYHISACGVVITLLLRGANRRCRNRTVWIKDWIRNRHCYGAYHHLVQEFQLGDTNTYRNVMLMNSSTFEELLSFVEPQITFHDTHLREAIPAVEMSWFTFSSVHVAAIILSLQLITPHVMHHLAINTTGNTTHTIVVS